MTPAIRSTGVYGSAATETGMTMPLPTGWQANDLCYIGYCLLASSPFLTLPAGWTEIVPQFVSMQNANTIHGVLRRVLQGGDGAPVFVGASGRWAGISVAITGYKTTPTEDTAAVKDDGVLATFPDVRIPSITSVTAAALMIGFACTRNGTSGFPISFAPPAGMTEVAEISSDVTSNVAIELCSLTLPTPTTTWVKIATPSAGTHTGPAPMGTSIVIRDAEAPDFDNMILCQETGHHLLQENRHHLLLES